MRHAMGIAVFAGMIGVTSFGLFLTPIFYVILRSLVASSNPPADGGSNGPDEIDPEIAFEGLDLGEGNVDSHSGRLNAPETVS